MTQPSSTSPEDAAFLAVFGQQDVDLPQIDPISSIPPIENKRGSRSKVTDSLTRPPKEGIGQSVTFRTAAELVDELAERERREPEIIAQERAAEVRS